MYNFVAAIPLGALATVRGHLQEQWWLQKEMYIYDVYLAFDDFQVSFWADGWYELFSTRALSKACVISLMSQIEMFMGPTWGPPWSCRPKMGPILAPMNLAVRGAISSAIIPDIYDNRFAKFDLVAANRLDIHSHITKLDHHLTHWSLNKMADICQTTFRNTSASTFLYFDAYCTIFFYWFNGP